MVVLLHGRTICRNIVYTRFGIHYWLFYGENLISENCLWCRHCLIKAQDHSLQPLTLLTSITDICMRVFCNSHSENFGQCPVEFHFEKIERLQSTSYYQTKNSTTETFPKVIRKKKIFQNFENSKINFARLFLFSKTCSPE